MAQHTTRTARWLALAAACLAASVARAGTLTIDDFRYATPEDARRAWTPSPISPTAIPQPEGGLTLPCPFGKKTPRVYWDRAVSLDLSRSTSLEIDLSCDTPQAFRSFNIYLKSGNGWYIWSGSLPEPGRQRLCLLKNDFQTEGRPLGWHRIELVRLSAWEGVPQNTQITVYSLQARANSILLVQNTTSTSNSVERSFAAKVNQRISRWLMDLGIPHGVLTDDDVARGELAGARIAILGYNPHPPARELEALRAFVRGGGKLLVFYASDVGLADLMQVRLSSYQRTETPGRWSSFAFTAPDAWNVPRRVYQESFNLMPAAPAGDSASVIAWWEDANGKRTEQPAWIASENGLWMTHVLLDDDAQSKRIMLLGLLGRYEPSVWAEAARASLERAGKIDSFQSLPAARQAIVEQTDRSSDPGRVRQLLQTVDSLHEHVTALYQQGKYRQVIAGCREVRAALVEAYGRVQKPKAGEFRGVWEHDGTGWYPGDWDRTCRTLADSGMTAVFPNMLWAALAHYPSKVLPQSFTVKRYGDQLAQCVEAAHQHGLQVHVWQVCWNLNGSPADYVQRMKKQGRLQVQADGRTIPWLCPSHPQNTSTALNSVKEIARTYAVDGIHLDYIRFSSDKACYCSFCRSGLEKRLGKRVANWPADAKPGGRYAGEFRKYRVECITAFVRSVRERVREINPRIKISAAVWGNYPSCIDSVGQDWAVWLRKNYVDFVCPMNYTTDASRFAALTHGQLALSGARGRVYPGLGVTADESQLRPDQVIEQVASARRLGAAGFMLFDLSYTLREDALPALRWGLTAPAD